MGVCGGRVVAFLVGAVVAAAGFFETGGATGFFEAVGETGGEAVGATGAAVAGGCFRRSMMSGRSQPVPKLKICSRLATTPMTTKTRLPARN